MAVLNDETEEVPTDELVLDISSITKDKNGDGYLDSIVHRAFNAVVNAVPNDRRYVVQAHDDTVSLAKIDSRNSNDNNILLLAFFTVTENHILFMLRWSGEHVKRMAVDRTPLGEALVSSTINSAVEKHLINGGRINTSGKELVI